MAWLALGSSLLAWAALGNSGTRRFDWLTGLCAIALAAAAVRALRVYGPAAAALIMCGALVLALALRRLRIAPRQGARAAAVLAGITAIVFALFGPAGGLF